ncbi:ATP-grasp domain-containing protein [Prosthecobacter sp.]|uniref:ATP-grasp domain-containing protein n=1 Tax=Prosthecobacter sp. TaxID=1965333 RepID=UPI003783D869
MSESVKDDHSVTVLLGPRATDDSVAIWRVCVANHWSVHRIQAWRVPDELLSCQNNIIIYGEPLFAEAVADQLNLVLLEPAIDWLTSVPFKYLSRQIEFMTLGSARLLDSPAFVKPADGKIFDPKVYATGQDLPSEEQVDQDIPVLRSGIMDFRLEVRCFVLHRKLMTMSPYWREGELARSADDHWPFLPHEENEARSFVESILSDTTVPLPPACTLDVGKTSDGTWAIIEANPCWGAGLYGCAPSQVLQTIRSAIVPRSEVTQSHRPWISKRRNTSA